MKKLLSAVFALFSIVACPTTSCETATQQTKNILAQHGLQYGRVNHLNSITTFDQAVASGAQIFVKFGAPRCAPCRKMTPILEQLAPEFRDVLFIEINSDFFESLTNRCGIRGIPTVLLFKGGSQASKTVGFRDKHHWISIIRSTFN